MLKDSVIFPINVALVIQIQRFLRFATLNKYPGELKFFVKMKEYNLAVCNVVYIVNQNIVQLISYPTMNE